MNHDYSGEICKDCKTPFQMVSTPSAEGQTTYHHECGCSRVTHYDAKEVTVTINGVPLSDLDGERRFQPVSCGYVKRVGKSLSQKWADEQTIRSIVVDKSNGASRNVRRAIRKAAGKVKIGGR